MSTDAPEVEDKPVSVVYDHCKKVYDEMVAQARNEVISPSDHEADSNNYDLVYEGHLTKLFSALGLSTPYYTSVMNHLKTMGCVEQLRRGGGNSPSRWRMLRMPDEEAFKSIETMQRRTRGKTAALEQQLRDVNGRVSALEAQQRNDQATLKATQDSLATTNELLRKVMEALHDADQLRKVGVS